MNKRTNRRAYTFMDKPVRNNSIFDVFTMSDGYAKSRKAFHFARHMHDGSTYTGPVDR